MTLLRRALWLAAKRAASDPNFRARAADFARDEVAPRARDAAERAQPLVNEAARRTGKVAGDIRKAAEDHSPLDEPGSFLKAAHGRLKDRG